MFAPTKVRANCTSTVHPEERQHGESIAVMCPGFNNVAGQYKTRAQLKIQSGHVFDRKHPYPNPAPGHQHHHSPEPDQFIFVQYFDIVSSGNESALLAGLPAELSGNPYSTLYNVTFRAEDNAVFANIANWSGRLQIPNSGGGLNGFNFNVDVLGSGGGLGLSWSDGAPPADKLTLTWTGDTDKPVFTFSYLPGFTFDNNSVFQVVGYVKTKRPTDEFGRVIAPGFATVLEDVYVFDDQDIQGLLRPSVYDVVHGKEIPPVPAPLPLLGVGSFFGVIGRLRNASSRRKSPPRGM